MRRRIGWWLSAVAIVIAAHQITIVLTPRALMFAVMHRLAVVGGVNQIVHAPRADERQRSIVMPSPDFLYSYCVYDLSRGRLRIRATIPTETYWSLSAYDARTDNFFVTDDKQHPNHQLDLLLTSEPLRSAPDTDADRIVRSPGVRGVLLFRTLIERDQRAGELDQARRLASCQLEPVPAR